MQAETCGVELHRNEGSAPNVELAKQLHLFDIQVTGGNSGDLKVANDPRYKKSVMRAAAGDSRIWGVYARFRTRLSERLSLKSKVAVRTLVGHRSRQIELQAIQRVIAKSIEFRHGAGD